MGCGQSAQASAASAPERAQGATEPAAGKETTAEARGEAKTFGSQKEKTQGERQQKDESKSVEKKHKVHEEKGVGKHEETQEKQKKGQKRQDSAHSAQSAVVEAEVTKGEVQEQPNHVVQAEQLFNELRDAHDAHSLLKKHLTEELSKSVDHSLCYAPDSESYRVFAPLFDAVIDEYHHGFAPDAVHPQENFRWEDVPEEPLDPTGDYFLSTRVRVARNLKDFPLGPLLSEEQRLEIEKRVAEALSELEDEQKGTYYPLEGMDRETQEKLTEDHFLFKEGDRFWSLRK
ncbi:MAG: hypothetical protein MHM6MM_000634 [Cercozoa sp. M6MM]